MAVNAMQNTVLLWFCRTLIHCSIAATNETQDKSNPIWSGSPFCADNEIVANGSQTLLTTANTSSTLLAIVCIPVLGALSDRVGRRKLLILSAFGMLVQVLFFVLASLANVAYYKEGLVNTLSVVLLLFGITFQGGTDLFSITVTTMIIDVHKRRQHSSDREDEGTVSQAETDLGNALGKLQGVKAFGVALGSGVGFYFVTLNLENYTSMLLICVVPTVLAILCVIAAPETLLQNASIVGEDLPSVSDENQRTRCQTFCSPYRLLRGSWVLSLIALAVFLFVLGISCLSVCLAFMTLTFGWTSTQSTLALLVGLVCGLISLFCAGRIPLRIRPLRAIFVASTIATCGVAIMALAPLSWFFFMLGLLLMSSSAFGIVAYLQWISAQVDPGQMGALQGALGACAMTGQVLGSNVFLYLFVWLGERRWICFLIGAADMSLACGLLAYLSYAMDRREKPPMEQELMSMGPMGELAMGGETDYISEYDDEHGIR
jgi:DHA1 family tetracycline resistance protein-like MFS transporter